MSGYRAGNLCTWCDVYVLFWALLVVELYQNGIAFDRETVIARCVAHKRNVVEADEFDTGVRNFLNLGHTVGHAIEKASEFSISHGRAVATGICIVARAVVKEKIYPKPEWFENYLYEEGTVW